MRHQNGKMKNFSLLFIFLFNILQIKAEVSLYYVQGLNQTLIKAESIPEWCEETLLSGPFDECQTTPSEAFGVLYNSLVEKQTYVQDPLPKKITLKNYLRIKDYYLFTSVQESMEDDPRELDPFTKVSDLPPLGSSLSDVWVVMNPHGHVVMTFKFCYAHSGSFPRTFAALVTRPAHTPTWNDISVVDGPDDWSLYQVGKEQTPERLLVLARGGMALYTNPYRATLLDEASEKENPTVKQTDLIPVLREFMDIQMGRKKEFTDARKDILALLPKARKLAEDFRKGKLKKLPMAAPKPKAPSFLPSCEGARDQLARLLHFPAPEQYQPTTESGPDPEFVDHCREDWLKPFNIHKVFKERQEYAAIWLHLYLSPAEDQRIHLIIAQCGTRALALQTLARMRFWEAQRQKKDPGELTAEKVAAQTNVSDKLAGDFSLYLKGRLDKFGNLSPNGPYSSIFFLRGTTAVGLVSDNPGRSVLPMAQKLDTELKKLRNRKSKYRKEMPVRYISPEDADKYKEFLKGTAPETGGSQ